MLDCLPSPADWSPQSQFLMLYEHLEAMRHHLDVLEQAAQNSAQALVQEGPHFREINQRCLESHELLEALGQQPPSVLLGLTIEEE